MRETRHCGAGGRAPVAWLGRALAGALGLSVAGTPAAGQSEGVWSALSPTPAVGLHACHLPGGKVLLMGFAGNEVYLFDPRTEEFTPAFVTEHMFCAGHAGLADGRLLVAGGGPLEPTGVKECLRFDPLAKAWTRLPDTVYARWYPTLTTLPDGRILAVAGRDEVSERVRVPEVYDPMFNEWKALPVATRSVANYAFMFVLPDGTVLDAGRDTAVLDPATWRWRTAPVSSREGGCAVMYEPGKVMKSGGDGEVQYLAIADAWVGDFTGGLAPFRSAPPMNHPRRRHNLTLLPDGRVFCSGGTRVGNDDKEAVLECEIWDPATEAWTPLPPIATARMYHSTSLLLADGRVLSTGGNHRLTYQVYSPGYLFRGARPEVEAAPRVVDYAGTFPVRTTRGAVAGVTLVRHGAVTHAFDQNQRFVRLDFTENGDVLTVALPPGPNLAPPGAYMLFLLSHDGAPSIGHDIILSIEETCLADFDDNHTLDIFDFLTFANEFAGGRARSDLDHVSGVGVLDVFDFLMFQNLYDFGCAF